MSRERRRHSNDADDDDERHFGDYERHGDHRGRRYDRYFEEDDQRRRPRPGRRGSDEHERRRSRSRSRDDNDGREHRYPDSRDLDGYQQQQQHNSFYSRRRSREYDSRSPRGQLRDWDEGKQPPRESLSAGEQSLGFYEQLKKEREAVQVSSTILRHLWASTPDILSGLKADLESGERSGKDAKSQDKKIRRRRNHDDDNEDYHDDKKKHKIRHKKNLSRSRSRSNSRKRRHKHHSRRHSKSRSHSRRRRRSKSRSHSRGNSKSASQSVKAETTVDHAEGVKRNNDTDYKHSDSGDEWVERKVAQLGDDIFIGPAPLSNADNLPQVKSYGRGLMRGEGEAIAAFVQSGKRIPRRGEIGLESEQIQRFEDLGFVMSGSRHHVMNMMRMRKENQVIGVEEKRQLLKFAQEERMRRENEIVSQFRQVVQEKLPTDLQELNNNNEQQ